MLLLIEVDDELYNRCLKIKDFTTVKSAIAIGNGIPIKEGDAISRSALREEISNAFINGANKSIFKKYIDNAPSL